MSVAENEKPRFPGAMQRKNVAWKSMAVVVTIVVAIPVALGFPAVFSGVVPGMVLVPAALALLIQLMPPFIRLAAPLAVFADCVVEIVFSFLDGALAMLTMIVGVRIGPRSCDCDGKSERSCPGQYQLHDSLHKSSSSPSRVQNPRILEKSRYTLDTVLPVFTW